MRKEKFLLVLSGVAFLLLFGVVSGHAQTQTVLSGTGYQYSKVDDYNAAYGIAGLDLVTTQEALTILKAQYDLVNVDPSGMTEAQEANQGVRLAYYPHLADLIQTYNDLNIALPTSAAYLEQLVDAHKSGLGLDPAAIYQETVNLLKN
jgi:hypothetical protein